MSELLTAVIGALGSLFSWLTGRSEAARDNLLEVSAEDRQAARNAVAAANAESAMAGALASSPKTKADFDAELKEGNF